MKLAKLPDGRTLKFAADDPDEVMDSAVRDMLANDAKGERAYRVAAAQAEATVGLLNAVRALAADVARNHKETLRAIDTLRADQRAAFVQLARIASADKVPVRNPDGSIERVVTDMGQGNG